VRCQEPKEPGFKATLVGGVFAGIAMLVCSAWFSEGVLKASLLTVGLFWGLTTSFTARWHDGRFWMIVAVLFAVHVVLISGAVERLGSMHLYSLLAIGIPEALVMFLILVLTGNLSENAE